ncbi:MAG: hypothetical protein E7384_06950 [Ruminococcaceae bacterium]|nr:hypothetical protein [Oscillospiraceae bacterium]
MGKMTVKQAAEKWGVTPRRVQELCKKGDIVGAQLWERTWMIPLDAEYPSKKNKNQTFSPNLKMPRKTPFLDMTDIYDEIGNADECAKKLDGHQEAKALYLAEIAYSRGEIDKVYAYANYFLENHTGFYAIIAGGVLLAMCALWKGDIDLWKKAKLHICEAPCRNDIDRDILDLSLSVINLDIRDTKEFPEWFKRGSFLNLPADAHPVARMYYVKYLMTFAQEVAMEKRQQSGVERMGIINMLPHIVEPFITQAVVDKTVMAELYMRLLAAITYKNSGNQDMAVMQIDKAITIALADGFLGTLVEHRRQLGYLLDERLALVSEDALKKVKTLHRQLHEGWVTIHNKVLDNNVTTAITMREREVVRLALFGLSDSEIAERLNISKSTVKSLISMAKNKTGSIKRSELIAYI